MVTIELLREIFDYDPEQASLLAKLQEATERLTPQSGIIGAVTCVSNRKEII